MAGQNGKTHTTHRTLAVTLVLVSLLPRLTCFYEKSARNSVEHTEVDRVAAALDVRTGRIVANEEFLSQSVPAALKGEPAQLDSDQLDGTGVAEWTLKWRSPTASEAALRQMNASLHCGENTMMLKVTGPRAADFEMDMGDGQPTLLTEVPETCGLSVEQNAECLSFVVSTTGCNMREENGNHVLSIIWLGTPVNLTCPIHPTPGAQSALVTSDPAEKPRRPNYTHKPWNIYARKRRHVKSYTPYWFGSPMYPMYVTPSPATTTTPKPKQMPPYANPYSPYYYHPYYPYPYHSHYFQSPIKGPTSPTTTATTTMATPTIPHKHPNLCPPYPPAIHPLSLYYYYLMHLCYGKPYIVHPVTQTTEFPPYTIGPTPATTTMTPTTNTVQTTTKRCKFYRPAGIHQIKKPYESYQEKPFDLYFFEKFNYGDDAEKGRHMLRAAYNPTDDSEGHLYPGFDYWLPQEP